MYFIMLVRKFNYVLFSIVKTILYNMIINLLINYIVLDDCIIVYI